MSQTIPTSRERGRGQVLWTPEHRSTTAGALLIVTLLAFENMGSALVMAGVTALGALRPSS